MDAKLVNLKQDTPEWLEYRFNHIGSSDAPIILGVSPYKTRYQLWLEKVNRQSLTKTNPAIQRGKNFEPVAMDFISKKHNVEFSPLVIEHKKLSWMSASLDAYNSDLDVFYEIKTANRKDHELLDKDGIIPEKYKPQLDHQLYVAKMFRCKYLSFYNGDVIIAEYVLDKENIRSHVKQLRDFYELVIYKKEPKLSDKDYLKIKDKRLIFKIQQLKSLEADIEKLNLKREKIKDALIQEAINQNHERLIIDDKKLRKQYRKKNINYAKIISDYNIDAEKYRPDGFIESWVLK